MSRLRGPWLGGTAANVALVAALLVAAEAEALARDHHRSTLVAVAFSGVAVLCLLARRRAPVPAAAAAYVFAFASIVWVHDDHPGQLSMALAVVVAGYSVGAHEERWSVAWVTGATAAMIAATAFATPSDIVFPTLFFTFLPWLGGRLLRSHRAASRELALRTVLAEEARADDRDRAIARERARIARELHDVLAHNLSAIVVQAGAARRVLERDPDAAAEAARLIAHTGREALAELRHLTGAVYRDAADALDGPPTLARVTELVEGAREAGLDASLRVEGRPIELPSGMELAAYRVVQEALTNALKHAGPARAGVVVRYEPMEVILEIIDDGAGASADPALSGVGGGHGIVGMRERVGLYGGTVQVGPAPEGGFAVRARLPLAGAVAA